MTATYDCIATTTLGSDTASVTFSSISGSYTDLVIIASCKPVNSGTSSSIGVQLNSDTGSNYSRTLLYGNGSSASSTRDSSVTSSAILFYEGTSPAVNILHIFNYANTTTYKTFIARANFAGSTVRAGVGLWRSTAAITSVTLLPTSDSFASGSTFSLFGIKAE